jgi:tight adherence protein C
MAVLLTALVAAGLALWAVSWRRRSLGLAGIEEAGAMAAPAGDPSARPGVLGGWLALAGYWGAAAVPAFVAATAVAVAAGGVVLVILQTAVGTAATGLRQLPGGVGDMFVAALEVLPWAGFLLCALAPTLWVRAARQRLVRDVDRDLPLVLELLATLAQAGLGLDAALSRVVEVQPGQRPLSGQLRRFQRDLLSGAPRPAALRNLAARVDVTSLTVFVAAVIQAEQVGASMAETLRHQADDLRIRRRERALLAAQSLPVKLVLPLVVCFLPGIFLSTLGPVLYQMIQVADSVLRPVGR